MRTFKNTLLIIAAFCIMGCQSQTGKADEKSSQIAEITQDTAQCGHLSLFGLHGPVAEVKVTYFDGYPSMEIYRFDEQGRLTHYNDFVNPGSDPEKFWETMYQYDYWYDDNGQICGDEEDIKNFPQPYYDYEEYGNPDKYSVIRNSHGDIITFELKSDPDFNGTISWTYDINGNWIGKAEEWLNEYDAELENVVTREIRYYTETALMGLKKGVHIVRNSTEDDGRIWKNEYVFDRDGMLESFQSYVDDEPLYDWHRGQKDLTAEDLLIQEKPSENTKREIIFW